ncbi:MAG: hypothetical protein L0H83_05660 [Salinisphaera sp.]|nr:hypothetical protein [Salinisphaera sp.]
MRCFSRDTLCEAGEFRHYRRVGATHAARVHGAFEVATLGGRWRCADGYLVVDERGDLRPVERSLFESHYEVVE